MKYKDLTSQKFNRLTVLEKVVGKSSKGLWKCRCDCGNIVFATRHDLTSNHKKSCGCFKKDYLSQKSSTHKLTKTRIYKIWIDMKKRCYNHNQKYYCNYGGRGISICDEWKQDFISFYNWSIKNGYNDDLSIDRINNDGDYCPNNCRWANRTTQNNNSRHNRYITYNGKTLTMSQWAKYLNLTYSCLKTRFRRGWSVEKALTTPAK